MKEVSGGSEKNVPIKDRVSDHGISVGIYFHDPDGNGVEVSYELPRSEWPLDDKVFSSADKPRGLFPGPWDEYLTEQPLTLLVHGTVTLLGGRGSSTICPRALPLLRSTSPLVLTSSCVF